MLTPTRVRIVGAGLAGSECANFLAERGIEVILQEMRPTKTTEAHHTENFAELVCSNSLKSDLPDSAPGILKAEMQSLGSLILKAARDASVPAGAALGVDRDIFSTSITRYLSQHPRIRVERGELESPHPNEITVLATGPLTSPSLSQWLSHATGEAGLYFYDAIAPIVDAESLDRSACFLANRYDKGEEAAYINCPLSREEYEAFLNALYAAEKVEPKAFEKEKFFQGCQPIEAIAATGPDSLRFGPMKPVGLVDPRTGKRPHAVVQLRAENRELTSYNLVGFQTKLKYGEQSKVFRLIPALKNAEFLRLGSIHRNTYVCAPRVLNADLSLRSNPNVFVAGQLSGVEGYLESAACGLMVGIGILKRLRDANQVAETTAPAEMGPRAPGPRAPKNTAFGALWSYLLDTEPKHFQPANIQFGLFHLSAYADLPLKDKALQKQMIARQSIEAFNAWRAIVDVI